MNTSTSIVKGVIGDPFPHIREIRCQYRCRECHHIFERLSGLPFLFSSRNCPQCHSANVEPWKPGRSSAQPIFGENPVRPKPGSVICCDFGLGEHSGIYAGGGKILHQEEGSGRLLLSSPKGFAQQEYHGIPNFCVNLYVSCVNGKTLAFPGVLERALTCLRSFSGMDSGSLEELTPVRSRCANAHAFVDFCISGKMASLSCSFANLEIRMGETSDFDTWRQWEGLDNLMG